MIEFPLPDFSQTRDMQLNTLKGLFNFRNSLASENTSSEEIALVEVALGEWLYARSERQGIDQTIGECFLLGMVDNRADVLKLLEPKIRDIDQKKSNELLDDFPIIGIVGRIASGKGTVGQIFKCHYDSFHFPFSNQLRQHALIEGYTPPFSRAQLRKIDSELKPRLGKQVFVDWTLQAARRMAKNLHLPQIVSVDGFRSIEETQWFLEQPSTSLIAVVASLDQQEDIQLRYERTLTRMREGEDPPTFEAFCVNDSIEGDWIDPILKLAEHTFVNKGNVDELEEEVISYYRKVI